MNESDFYSFEIQLSTTQLFKIAHFFSKKEGSCFLYSGGNLDSANKSFLGLFPIEKSAVSLDHLDPWERLSQLIGDFSDNESNVPKWIGYLSYEMGCFSDENVKIPHQVGKLPLALFYQLAITLVYDNKSSTTQIFIRKSAQLLFKEDQKWYEKLLQVTAWEELASSKFPQPSSYNITFLRCSDTQESYFNKIDQIKNAISQGDVYQLNLSQEFIFHTNVKDSFSIFQKIVFLNPASFTAFLNCGSFQILSSSPERFLNKNKRQLETRPIKGTCPRGKNPLEDEINKKELLSSEKERAELLMITDLMRNDLSRISSSGSVVVKEMWGCEKYSNVFHLVSIIQAQAKNSSPIGMVKKIFPGGSITGCPKLKAMELISKLENSPREIYTGSIGYFTGDGDFDFNIAIRTLVFFQEEELLHLRLGGGIVADSNAQKEYEETLHKGRTLFKVLGIEQFVVN